jgi:hypothetical protein
MSFASIATSLVGSLVGKLLFDDEPQQAQQAAAPTPTPAPTPEPVTPMPTPGPNDKAVREAKKKSIAAITARQGRASTILTGEDGTGGGGGSLGG